jgi:RNA polymerase sigma-70 factor (ECF subfamily)
MIYNIGMRFFKNSDESYDYTQEVFLRAHNKLTTYKGIAPFRFWLTRLAYNFGINSIKSLRSEPDIAACAEPADDDTPEKNHLKDEIIVLLENEIMKLPGKYRVCLDLFFFARLTYPQISAVTGFPVNTIKSHVLRAKHALRDALKGTIAEDYHEM